ncbi:MAG: hypothetical protein WCC55_04295 [Nitrosotalea sp.]
MRKELDVVSYYKELLSTIDNTQRLHGIANPSDKERGGGCGRHGVYIYILKRFDENKTFWLPYWEYEMLSAIENVFPSGTMEKPSCQIFIVGCTGYNPGLDDIAYYTTPLWIEKNISSFDIFEGKILISKNNDMVNARRWEKFLETGKDLRDHLLSEKDTAYEYFPYDLGNPKYFMSGEIICKVCESVLANGKEAKGHSKMTGHNIH